MTAAACKAVYSDWKLIRTRSCVQIVFEVPIEAAGEAYDALGGMPDPKQSVWCAIARLRDGKDTAAPDTTPPAVKSPPQREAKKWHEMMPAQQAGILASDPKFMEFVRETRGNREPVHGDEAAEFIRTSCAVSSRSDILPGSNHAELWERLVSRFRAWERAPSVGAA